MLSACPRERDRMLPYPSERPQRFEHSEFRGFKDHLLGRTWLLSVLSLGARSFVFPFVKSLGVTVS